MFTVINWFLSSSIIICPVDTWVVIFALSLISFFINNNGCSKKWKWVWYLGYVFGLFFDFLRFVNVIQILKVGQGSHRCLHFLLNGFVLKNHKLSDLKDSTFDLIFLWIVIWIQTGQSVLAYFRTAFLILFFFIPFLSSGHLRVPTRLLFLEGRDWVEGIEQMLDVGRNRHEMLLLFLEVDEVANMVGGVFGFRVEDMDMTWFLWLGEWLLHWI